nr:uncharacterized protein LOC109174472 [Ipomoea batatas]
MPAKSNENCTNGEGLIEWTAHLCFEEPETALVSCKLPKECWSRMNTVLNPEGYSSFAEWIRDNLNALNIDDIVGV